MRIHLNHPTPERLLMDARSAAGVHHEKIDQHGSRTHHVAYDIILSGESGRRTNQRWGMSDEGVEAATWDQWGIYLAVIFEADPTATCKGGGNYENAEDFHRQTGGRFRRECDGCDLDPWAKPVHYGSCPLATENVDKIVFSQSSPDYKITAHRWEYDYERAQPLSGHRAYYCKGHSTKKNMRAECHAVRIF